MGTGLGMMLVKELVDKNGAEITVQSKIGDGTTFIVLFHNQKNG